MQQPLATDLGGLSNGVLSVRDYIPEPTQPVFSSALQRPKLANVLDSKLMIVDDEPAIVKVVKTYLEDAGYKHSISTTDSTRAFHLARDERPDLLILDIVMPELDGLQILQLIRNDQQLQYLPILIVTASTEAKTKLKTLTAWRR